MSSRAARVTVVLLLVAAGAGAGVFLWDNSRRLEGLEDARANVDATLESMLGAATEIPRLQHDYVASGRPDETALSAAAMRLDSLRADAGTLSGTTLSADGSSRMASVSGGLTSVTDVDARIRDHVTSERLSAAADLAAGAALDAAEELIDRLAQLRSVERAAARAARRNLQRQQAQVLGAAAFIWLVGLILLARRPTAAAVVPDAAEPIAATPPPAPAPVVDLTEAAAVCAAIAQVTSTDALPALLARAATVLEASGVVVWMGAGDDLFAVTGHGYDARLLGRLGPIRRQADNATAAAWRTGETRIVAADTMSNGAIVAPMTGAAGCIGVLAVEVRRGRETDATVQAATAIIAAQLATALAAWPQASGEQSTDAAADARLHA